VTLARLRWACCAADGNAAASLWRPASIRSHLLR